MRQVLAHTAGLPDVTDYVWNKPEYDDKSLERWIRGLRDSTLIGAPGAKWMYSNIGFELLAHLVAMVSGETFEGYVQRHVLTPAGMKHSTFLMTDVDSANLATGHEFTGSAGPVRVGYPYNRRHAGSSTMHSSVDDMLRYGAIHAGRGTLDGKRILASQTYDLMWKPEKDISLLLLSIFSSGLGSGIPLSRVDMGLGWFMLTADGHRILNHNGGDTGFRSTLFVSPDHKTVVVVFVNSGANVTGVALSLLAAAIK